MTTLLSKSWTRGNDSGEHRLIVPNTLGGAILALTGQPDNILYIPTIRLNNSNEAGQIRYSKSKKDYRGTLADVPGKINLQLTALEITVQPNSYFMINELHFQGADDKDDKAAKSMLAAYIGRQTGLQYIDVLSSSGCPEVDWSE